MSVVFHKRKILHLLTSNLVHPLLIPFSLTLFNHIKTTLVCILFRKDIALNGL